MQINLYYEKYNACNDGDGSSQRKKKNNNARALKKTRAELLLCTVATDGTHAQCLADIAFSLFGKELAFRLELEIS